MCIRCDVVFLSVNVFYYHDFGGSPWNIIVACVHDWSIDKDSSPVRAQQTFRVISVCAQAYVMSSLVSRRLGIFVRHKWYAVPQGSCSLSMRPDESRPHQRYGQSAILMQWRVLLDIINGCNFIYGSVMFPCSKISQQWFSHNFTCQRLRNPLQAAANAERIHRVLKAIVSQHQLNKQWNLVLQYSFSWSAGNSNYPFSWFTHQLHQINVHYNVFASTQGRGTIIMRMLALCIVEIPTLLYFVF